MDITDVQRCADFYQLNYFETFYIVGTYSGKSFALVGEKENFPHLMGISKPIYKSNGYKRPFNLYKDILTRKPISKNVIPQNISQTSKMYRKVINFCKSTNAFWKNKGPLAVNYNPLLNSHNLKADVLISDIKSGYIMGWKHNINIAINAEINLEKYCFCSWIDESNGNTKEKYLSLQDTELIRHVFAFNKRFELIKQKIYKYSGAQKKYLLLIIERNNGNLLVDKNNERHYIKIAKEQNIHCRINGIQY